MGAGHQDHSTARTAAGDCEPTTEDAVAHLGRVDPHGTMSLALIESVRERLVEEWRAQQRRGEPVQGRPADEFGEAVDRGQ